MYAPKSRLIKKLAKKLGLVVHKIKVAPFDPRDLDGMPVKVEPNNS